MSVSGLIITLAIICGQLVKVPLGKGGATLIDLVTIGLCLFGLLQIKFKLKKPPTFILAGLLFCLVAILSLILTPLSLTIEEYLVSFLYIFRFFIYILLGWLIFSKALSSLKQNINKILIISGVSLSVLGLLQFIFIPDLRFLAVSGWDPHYYRTASTFLDPNFAGGFFVLTLILLFQNVAMAKKWNIIFFIVVYLALLTTFSRSSYLMFLISFLVLAFFKKSLKIASLATVLFLMLLLSFQIYIRTINLVTPLDRNQTASYRFSTWQQGFELFLKNPILGVGFNAYNFALKEYNLANEQFLAGRGSTTNDSSLIHVASTTGILGLLAYLYFLFNLCKNWKKKPILSAAVLGLVGHSFFVNSLFYPFLLIWIILYASN